MFRCMNTNKRGEIWYSLYQSSTELTEEKEGYVLYTGEKGGVYSELKSAKVNISPNKGDAESDVFGTDIQYDKVLVFDKTGPTDIDEYSRLWIDVEPYVDKKLQPHDYEVVSIATTHDNSAYSIAVKRVKRNEKGN